MLRRRRPLMRLGATAVVAGTAAHYGAKAAQANAAPEQPDYPPQGYPPPGYPPPQGYPGNGSSAPESAESAQIEELKRLAALRDQGILTAEEFAAKKAQILGI